MQRRSLAHNLIAIGSAPITVEFDGDYIMPSSVLTARAWSTEPFALTWSGDVLLVRTGNSSNDESVRSTGRDGNHCVEVELGGWIKAMPLDDDPEANAKRGYASNYGGRFYPFVSSLLRGTVTAHARRIEAVRLSFPDPYRPGWGNRKTVSDLGELAVCTDTPRRGGWNNYFHWRECVSGASLLFPLRLAGPTLSRTVGFPIAYWVLSLIAIVLASRVAEPEVVGAATVAIVGFLLQQWSQTERPHRLSLTSALYMSAAALAALWATSWVLLGWWAALLTVPYALIAVGSAAAVYRFTRTGRLPRRVVFFWQRGLVLMRRFAVWSGLHEGERVDDPDYLRQHANTADPTGVN